jgi:glucose-6-phosphate isomerase
VAAIIEQEITNTLSDEEWGSVLNQTEEALAQVRQQSHRGPLRLPAEKEDIGQLIDVAERWRGRFSRIVLFGVGGSSLGARALSVLAGKDAPELVVPDNLDPETMAGVLQADGSTETGYLVISKSGGTAETLAQTLATVGYLQGQDLSERFLFITEPRDSPLRAVAEEIGASVIDHDLDIGGRFSVLTKVGLLPAMMLGLDPWAIRAGAADVLTETLSAAASDDNAAAQGAALNFALREYRGVAQTVLFAYADRLRLFNLWYRQIWAESLGKGGSGSTPIDALGPLDQHSQLQLYLDGPKDKLFTILSVTQTGTGPAVEAGFADRVGAGYLGGCDLARIVAASGQATADALIARGLPVRQLRLSKLDEEAMGAPTGNRP